MPQPLVPENLAHTPLRIPSTVFPAFPSFESVWMESLFWNLLAAAAGAHPPADPPLIVLREGRVERFTKPYGKAASASQFITQET